MKRSFGTFVRYAIARHLGLPESCIEPSQRLRDDLGLLPLDLVLVALRLEDLVNTRFPVDRLSYIHTVEELTELLWSCRCARPTDPRGVAELDGEGRRRIPRRGSGTKREDTVDPDSRAARSAAGER